MDTNTLKAMQDHLVNYDGWTKDRFGAYRKTVFHGTKMLLRIKFQDKSVRIEKQLHDKTWVRIGGAFYSRVKLHTDGNQLQIGTDFFPKQRSYSRPVGN